MFLTEIVVHTLRNKMETHRFYDLAYKKCNDLGNTGLGNTMISWNVFVLFLDLDEQFGDAIFQVVGESFVLRD